MKPRVMVCAGGGGVGKTTTSAALALALARAGHRTLVVTVDPARRLADAMEVEIDADVHGAHVEPGVEGKLFALMPEPRRSTRTFVELLFEDEPEALKRMLDNRVYAALGDAMAGIHDLVSLMLVARAVQEASYDYLVVDTAPSRYALDFVSYPGRLAALLEGRAVGFFANLAQRAAAQEAGEPPQDEKGLIAWGKKRVESAIGRILDPRTITDLTGLFAELSLVRERFAALARASEALLLGSDTRYLLVAAPSGSAHADVQYVVRKLRKLKQRPTAFVLNRADAGLPEWARTLKAADGITLPLQQVLETLEGEMLLRKTAADEMERDLRQRHSGVRAVRLPTIEARDPSQIVRALADGLGSQLPLLGA